MIEYIVIDDESNPRELLIYTIKSLDMPFKLIGEGKNLLEGVELIKKYKPQVVFLDIQMPVHNGLKIKEFLTKSETNFKLIFITAFDQYSIQAIRLAAFDYLLKPIEVSELKTCLARILTEKKSLIYQQLNSIENNNTLVLNSHSGTHFIEVSDILFIAADGMYSQFNLKNNCLTSSKPLKEYEQIHPILFRCHRSYIVNTDHILKIEGNNICFKSGEVIPVSRINKPKLIQLLKTKT